MALRRLASCLTVAVGLAAGGCATDPVRQGSVSVAEAKAIAFLIHEVPAWSRDNGCFSCHNNGDAARALYEAKRLGYRVPASSLADTTRWVLQPEHWEHNKGDPGFSDKRLANVQFAASLLAAVETGHAKNKSALQVAARKLLADQDADGSWPIERRDEIGSPATYGTPLATLMALKTLEQAGALESAETIRKARRWLQAAPVKTMLDASVGLLAASRDSSEETRARRARCLEFIRQAQTSDGGWGPYKDSPAEPFDTAIVLLALSEQQLAAESRPMIEKGRKYLATSQGGDGSWPPTTRPSGGASYAQRMSTTGWATLALLATRAR
jgi:hypothetical protein